MTLVRSHLRYQCSRAVIQNCIEVRRCTHLRKMVWTLLSHVMMFELRAKVLFFHRCASHPDHPARANISALKVLRRSYYWHDSETIMASRSPARSPPRGRTQSRTPARSLSPRRSNSPDPRPRSNPPSRSPTPRSDRRSEDQNGKGGSRDRSQSPPRRARTYSRSPPRTTAKLVVTGLTKNVLAEHLTEIFGAYGQVKAVDLPQNRQCKHINNSLQPRVAKTPKSLHQSRNSLHPIS